MLSELDILDDAIRECEACELCLDRTQAVVGRGFRPRRHKDNVKVVFIGEAPGKDEDEEGEPFVGQSGTVLEIWVEWLGLEEDEWYITNIVKCRPPDNRDPKPKEITTCTEQWLYKEIKYLKPLVIVPVGRLASARFLGPEFKTGITDYRGTFYPTNKEYKQNALDKKMRLVYPVLHPSWFIRKGQGEKEEAWSDQLTELRDYLEKSRTF